MNTNYNLYEVSFSQGYSICIKSIYDNAESQKHNEELDKFLEKDIGNFGTITNIIPINYEEADRFFDLTEFDNWPVFGYETKLQDPWFVYELGDTYRNNNGEDYIILAMDKDKDKMILAKKSKLGDKSVTLFIGAKGIYMHSWSFGHYFMQNFEAACEWFNETKNEEVEGVLVKDFMEMYMGPEESSIFICNTNDFSYYMFQPEDIPPVLKKAKYHNIGVKTFYVDDCDIIGITLYIDFKANDINAKYFAEDYGRHEL